VFANGLPARRVACVGGSIQHPDLAHSQVPPAVEQTIGRPQRWCIIDLYRRAASYVDRILRGEKPGDLPVQLPTKFEMIVNRKAATALGLAIPPSILLRATEVIE
jgi:hypothetical protein